MSSWFKDLTDQVQSAIPQFDTLAVGTNAGTLLQSLTLTTPELTAERERIDAEEKRKANIRNALSGMLPWQTQDTERDILVEECKDAILLLSSNKETFFGPFVLPPMKTKPAAMNLDDDDGDNIIDGTPSEESLEKLAKLQPLPPLLENFELLAHVGLIEKVLKEDPNLVLMQSKLSGAGIREHIFWKNYFFHCAYTRYEAGLSIDEIWSEALKVRLDSKTVDHQNVSPCLPTPQPLPTTTDQKEEEDEETITFAAENTNPHVPIEATNTNATTTTELFGQDGAVTTTSIQPGVRTESEYEMIDEDKLLLDTSLNNVDNNNINAPLASNADDADYELDELEAEIARELED